MRLIWLCVLMLLPTFGFAQGAATLVADRVELDGNDRLIASGNVEAYYQGARLSASQIIYNQTTDRLTISGPIIIKSPDGTILTAERADLDPQLENGILQSARLVLDEQLQLVANQIDRSEGRYSQLYKTAVTSCQVCGNKAPLWDIRAERVVHDTEEQQLYFQNALFRIRGVPIFWLPRMRVPDPELERSNGILVPDPVSTDQLGIGLKLPYFITLGDSRDITLTPYVSSDTRTLEVIYRQAFLRGDLTIEGAISDDTLIKENRSYIFVDGEFTFGADYQLTFDVEAASDKAYLLDYGYSDKDRLDSAVEVIRVTDNSLAQTGLTYYQTLRDEEDNNSLPPVVADTSYETRLQPAAGGVLTFGASADSIYRTDKTAGAEGRDMTRVGVSADWQNSWVLPYGFVANVSGGVQSDVYTFNDDDDFEEDEQRTVPSVNATLRWPLARQADNGTAHVIEPAVAVALSKAYGELPPNEDSTRTELDQANLLDASRFGGDDVVETGSRAAFGVTWTRLGPKGVSSNLTFGRVVREEAEDEFTSSSGLDGLTSDWLLSGQLAMPSGLVFDARSLIDSDNGVDLGAGRISWQNATTSLAAAYIWQNADPDQDRDGTVSEWTIDADLDLNETWAINFEGRYDVAKDEPVNAGVGVQWRNECVTIDLSVSRRYTSSSTVDASTSYGLSGSLNGFSAGRSGATAASCKN